jgi:hypothetical protein
MENKKDETDIPALLEHWVNPYVCRGAGRRKPQTSASTKRDMETALVVS